MIPAEDAELPVVHGGIVPTEPVTSIVEGRLAAVATPVEAADFAEEELRAHLTDMSWVERVARAHEGVLDELCRRATVVPLRMCTVYLNEDRVREMLRREEERLDAALRQLEGMLEWGVKVEFGAESAPVTGSRAAAEDARQSGSGTEYLARRRAEREQDSVTERLLGKTAAEVHDALLRVAEDGHLTPVQAGAGRESTLSSGVYLVRRTRTSAFHLEVQRLQTQLEHLGLRLLETGPWPPYNFVPEEIGADW